MRFHQLLHKMFDAAHLHKVDRATTTTTTALSPTTLTATTSPPPPLLTTSPHHLSSPSPPPLHPLSRATSQVEILFARDWKLGSADAGSGEELTPYRTTWASGWWIDQVSQMFAADISPHAERSLARHTVLTPKALHQERRYIAVTLPLHFQGAAPGARASLAS